MGFDYTLMKWIQALGGADGSVWQKIVDFFFATITFMGEETFLLLGIFIVYWAFNKKFGEYLVMALFATVGINGLFKSIVARPRPFLNTDYSTLRYLEIDNFFVNTTGLSHSFSFPSGHSQLAGSLFTMTALYFKKKWLSILMAVLILLMMMSRVYLGVHYPSDVIVGGLLGVIVAFVVFYILNRYENKKVHILIMLFVLVIITFIYEVITDAPSAGNTLKMAGLALGAIVGFVIDMKKINFSVSGIWWKRVLRVALGFALVMGVRIALKPIFGIFSGDNETSIMVFDAIRYCLIGLTATALWPYIFTKVKL